MKETTMTIAHQIGNVRRERHYLCKDEIEILELERRTEMKN